MIYGKLRILGLALILAIGSLLVVRATGSSLRIFDALGVACLALGSLVLTKTGRPQVWVKAAILDLSIALILCLMLFDARPLLPGLILFIIIPTASGMPLAQRIVAYVGTATVLIYVYIARGLIGSVDPLVPTCQSFCIASLVAYTEIARQQQETMEESTKLLDGLIAAQKAAAEVAASEKGGSDRGILRKSVGALLAKAALQVEGTKELWPVDRAKAAQLSYKANETIRSALDLLREEEPAGNAASAAAPIRVLLAHSSPDMLESLSIVARIDGDIAVMATASNSDELLRSCEGDSFDAVLIDEDLAPAGGISALGRLLGEKPKQRCMIMSALPGAALERMAREAGAIELIDIGDNPIDMLATIRRAQGGARRAEPRPGAGPDFSLRELQILALIAKGFSNKEISERLFLAEGTVKNRVTSILQKIGARDRGNAALKARELGLI
jgi:DNA-binding NarL/FixJ family response regulator